MVIAMSIKVFFIPFYFLKFNKKRGRLIAIHPYVGIVRIRLEGIISARNLRAPLEYRVQRYE